MALDKRKHVCLKCGEVYHEDAPTCKSCGGMCVLASDEGLTASVLLGKSNAGIRDEVVKAYAQERWTDLVSAAQKMTQPHPSVLTPLGYCYLEGKGTGKDVEKALECFGKSVNCGDAEAAYALYTIFDSGKDVAPIRSVARHMLRLAAARGYKAAQIEYAKCLFSGTFGFDQDETAAAKLFAEVGEYGYHDLAKCHLYGKGVAQNVKEALRLFECDVGLGERSKTVAQSALYLGKIHFLGAQVPKDLAKAEYWLNISRGENDDVVVRFWLGRVYFESNRWQDAIELLADASVLSDSASGAPAKRFLGAMYRDGGNGVERDVAKAYQLISEAVAEGDDEALLELAKVGKLYLAGDGVAADAKVADEIEAKLVAKVLEEFAAKNWEQAWKFVAETRMDNPAVLVQIAECYLAGFGTAESVADAVLTFEKAVRLQSGVAALRLFQLFSDGAKVAKDDARALQYLNQAAAWGNGDALAALGQAYELGLYGFSIDLDKAVECYQKAGTAGYYYLGKCNESGVALLQDIKEAVRLYEAGFAVDDYKCALALGDLHAFGDYILPDRSIALKWYADAERLNPDAVKLPRYAFGKGYALYKLHAFGQAEKLLGADGCVEFRNGVAAYCLGKIYMAGGDTVQQDPARAIKCFETAVENGNCKAIAKLRDAYANGQGAPKDLSKAADYEKQLRDLANDKFDLDAFEQGIEIGKLSRMDDAQLLYRMGVVSFERRIGDEWQSEFVQFLEAAVDHDSGDAAWKIYEVFSSGKDVDKDEDRAGDYLKRAAALGNVQAEMRLAECLMRGECGFTVDQNAAADWYRKVGPSGYYNLAECFREGIGGKKDVHEAIRLLKLAFDGGDVKSARTLGDIYRNGEGAAPDYAEAEKWYKASVASGAAEDPELKCVLGICDYHLGRKSSAVSRLSDLEVKERYPGESNYYLGLIYRDGGDGVAQDVNQALSFFDVAAEHGKFRATAELRDVYEKGIGIEADPIKAGVYENKLCQQSKDKITSLEWPLAVEICCLTKLNNSELLFAIGECHYTGGNGLSVDKNEAARFYGLSADCGSAAAAWKLHRMYAEGDGVSIDEGKAKDMLVRAAESGYEFAQRQLGECYYRGQGGFAQSFRDAVEWFRKAGVSGYIYLAECYRRGTGVRRDALEAIRYYKLSADSEDQTVSEIAALELGDIYMNGEGIKADYDQALVWYRKASPNGTANGDIAVKFATAYCNFMTGKYNDAADRLSDEDIQNDTKFRGRAQCCLGIIYRDGGDGVKHNFIEAKDWFNRAIANGSVQAQYELGIMYYRGLGMSADVDEAKRLYQGALDGGFDKAGEALNELNALASGMAGQQTQIKSIRIDQQTDEENEKAPMTREEVWAAKLLDLSLDNRLINAADGKNVQFIPRKDAEWIDLQAIQTWLENGEDVAVVPLDKTVPPPDPTTGLVDESQLEKDVRDLFAHKKLCILGKKRANQKSYSDAFARKLESLLKESVTDMEEDGTQTLYLALGFLQWRDEEKNKTYLAPLILDPIKMESPGDDGTHISLVEDEVQLNLTLFQFLNQRYHAKINLPGSLPKTLSGVTDVRQVLGLIKGSLNDRYSDLKIIQAAAIGRFTFENFGMWRDVTEHADIVRKHPLIKHIIDHGGQFYDGDSVTVEEVRQELAAKKPGELFCPLSADSSQLTAVLMSEHNKSFVIEGPPGTGKSQTIVNIIAHNLAIGKRVLFVAKKDCALSVVKSRLDSVGLEPFCLELHADKKERSKVSKQFLSSFKVDRHRSIADWEEALEDVRKFRTKLGDYVEVLSNDHKKGVTAYDCFVKAFELPNPPHVKDITWDCLEQSGEDYKLQKRRLVEAYEHFTDVTNLEAIELFMPFKKLPTDYFSDKEFRNALEDVIECGDGILSAIQDISKSIQVPTVSGIDQAIAVRDALNKLVTRGLAITSVCDGDVIMSLEGVEEKFAKFEKCLQRVGEAKSALEKATADLADYDLDVLSERDVAAMEKELRALKGAWWFQSKKRLALQNRIQGLRKDGHDISEDELESAIPKFKAYRTAKSGYAYECKQTVSDVHPISEEERKSVARLAEEIDDWVAAKSVVDAYIPDSMNSDDFASIKSVCERIREKVGEINGVDSYLPKRNLAIESKLEPFVVAYEHGEFANRDALLDCFVRAYYGMMLQQILRTPSANENLFRMTARQRDPAIAKYRSLVNKYARLTKDKIYSAIAATYPDFREGHITPADNASRGAIQEQAGRKRGHKPVKMLLDENKSLVNRCKRCFLMSPTAVAKFLPMQSDLFDLLIFDEASQIEVCDAIGAMARCKQTIIVGDLQQMPPSRKIGSTASIAGSGNFDIDAESILAQCDPERGQGLPSIMLNWHYRSHHESLIEFSNRNYYGSGLYTFPSASNADSLGLRYFYVKKGGFEKGGRNPGEANAIVKYLYAQIMHPSYATNPRTIGIVAFNSAQQLLIDKLINDKRKKDPKFDDRLKGIVVDDGVSSADDGEDPVETRVGGLKFVRNLENVQGDEADVIIFSITYAANGKGNVSRNLGSLTQDGGHRRLNVAVTRAVEQMVVFASMKHFEMNIREKDSQGFKDLSAFLKFAENHKRDDAVDSTVLSKDGFVRTVSQFVKEHGYKIVTGVGCSDYKVDVAVVDPNDPKRYVLAIECDGPSYQRQLTVEDRDVLRTNQLEAGKWHVCRCWCADWFYRREESEKRLLKELEEATKPEKEEVAGPIIDDSIVANDDAAELAAVEQIAEAQAAAETDDQTEAEEEDALEKVLADAAKAKAEADAKAAAEAAAKAKAEADAKAAEAAAKAKAEADAKAAEAAAKAKAEADAKAAAEAAAKAKADADAKKKSQSTQTSGTGSVATVGHALPETKTDSECKLKPKALLLDGTLVRATKDWNDFFIAICEKLNAMDPALFETLPTKPKMGLIFKVKGVKGDYKPTKFGVNKDVCVSKYAGTTNLIDGSVGRKMLEMFGIDPSRIRFTA